LDLVADREADGRQDVALLPVGVVEERDARRAVRIVLDRGDPGRHAGLVALEVDRPVQPLVAAATMANRDPTAVVPSAGLLERGGERRLGLVLGELGEIEAALEAA